MAHRHQGIRERGDDHGADHGDDHGFAAFVVCFPAFFLVVILGIQFALWSHASQLARAAAEQGSQVAAEYGSSPPAGTAAAYHFIATTGPNTLDGPSVNTVTLPGAVASVTVTGRAQVLIPWISLHVSSTAVTPIQEFRPEALVFGNPEAHRGSNPSTVLRLHGRREPDGLDNSLGVG